VIALLAAALLRRPLRRWETIALRVAPVVIVFCTTVYLGFHWITDSIAGVFLGLFLARLLVRIPWDRIPPSSVRESGIGSVRSTPRPASRA
jgi:membrane-associated phospholipid phosphatase